jgi:predicted secreted protein
MKRYGKDDAVIRARPGETFVLALQSTGGGYEWSIKQAEDLLRQVSHNVGPANEKIGGPTNIEYTFEALRAGQSDLVLEYGRSWEASTLDTRRITVIVEP